MYMFTIQSMKVIAFGESLMICDLVLHLLYRVFIFFIVFNVVGGLDLGTLRFLQGRVGKC
jgi:hypothetical protein